MAEHGKRHQGHEHHDLARLPSERDRRRGWKALLALLLSLLLHVGAVVLIMALAAALGLLRSPSGMVVADREPEQVILKFSDQRVKVPEKEPQPTNVIAEKSAKAASPGEGKPVPHGDKVNPDPDAGKRGLPQPEIPPQVAPPPEPKPPEADLEPSTTPSAQESLEDKRRRVADALSSLGSPGSAGQGGSGDHYGTPSSGIGFSFGGGGMQIESTSDVDWGPWVRRVTEKVKGNWYAIMPVAARVGMKGIVVVRFRVHRDGSISDWEQLESSAVPPLDQAVEDALVRMSVPLPPPPIPEDSDEESIRITYTFLYNLDDEREQRAWRRMNWQRQRAQQRPGG